MLGLSSPHPHPHPHLRLRPSTEAASPQGIHEAPPPRTISASPSGGSARLCRPPPFSLCHRKLIPFGGCCWWAAESDPRASCSERKYWFLSAAVPPFVILVSFLVGGVGLEERGALGAEVDAWYGHRQNASFRIEGIATCGAVLPKQMMCSSVTDSQRLQIC
ncbi:hypothetical protein VPH35_066912 [Triticum aestivum]